MNFLFFLILFNFSTALVNAKEPSCSTMGCHESVMKFSKLHGPMKANGCTVCHQLGESRLVLPAKHPRIQEIPLKSVNAQCTTCHEEHAPSRHPGLHKVISEKSCVECHSPHGSNNKHLLKINSTGQLCTNCHKEILGKLHQGHGEILSEKKSCLQCHESHFSKEKKLLKANVGSLCLECHQKKVQKKNGESLLAVEMNPAGALSVHKPVKEGQCQNCHDPHGSESAMYLKSRYSPTDDSLCISCHKKDLLANAKTLKATEFRNGENNLHFLHLNNRKKTQRCVECHSVHSSAQEKLILTQMKFGEWLVPVEFSKTDSGGTCMTACHGEKKYDRIKSFENKRGR